MKFTTLDDVITYVTPLDSAFQMFLEVEETTGDFVDIVVDVFNASGIDYEEWIYGDDPRLDILYDTIMTRLVRAD